MKISIDPLHLHLQELVYNMLRDLDNGVYHHEFAIQDHEHKSCEIYICGENKDGEWCDIKIYSLKPEELEEKLDSLEDKVLNMWKAFNE